MIVVWQAFTPENSTRRYMFMTMGYPYGSSDILAMSFIDINECEIMLEGCIRNSRMEYFGVRVMDSGHYDRGVKWTVTFAVAASGERLCRVDRNAGTTVEDIVDFTKHVVGSITVAAYEGHRIIMMDNHSAHSTQLINQTILQANEDILYRPKYSPKDTIM